MGLTGSAHAAPRFQVRCTGGLGVSLTLQTFPGQDLSSKMRILFVNVSRGEPVAATLKVRRGGWRRLGGGGAAMAKVTRQQHGQL